MRAISLVLIGLLLACAGGCGDDAASTGDWAGAGYDLGVESVRWQADVYHQQFTHRDGVTTFGGSLVVFKGKPDVTALAERLPVSAAGCEVDADTKQYSEFTVVWIECPEEEEKDE